MPDYFYEHSIVYIAQHVHSMMIYTLYTSFNIFHPMFSKLATGYPYCYNPSQLCLLCHMENASITEFYFKSQQFSDDALISLPSVSMKKSASKSDYK